MLAAAEVIGELVKVTDHFLTITSAAASYLLYHAVNGTSLARGPGRYTLLPLCPPRPSSRR
jgi:hypothetical protein